MHDWSFRFCDVKQALFSAVFGPGSHKWTTVLQPGSTPDTIGVYIRPSNSLSARSLTSFTFKIRFGDDIEQVFVKTLTGGFHFGFEREQCGWPDCLPVELLASAVDVNGFVKFGVTVEWESIQTKEATKLIQNSNSIETLNQDLEEQKHVSHEKDQRISELERQLQQIKAQNEALQLKCKDQDKISRDFVTATDEIQTMRAIIAKSQTEIFNAQNSHDQLKEKFNTLKYICGSLKLTNRAMFDVSPLFFCSLR